MSGYLVDTHVLLWSWHQPNRISPAQQAVLLSEAPTFVSHASLWEIAIKTGLGKLTTIDDPAGAAAEDHVLLPIVLPHIGAIRALPLHHRDPFDRMLIAQARAEGLTILTADRRFAAYDVAVV